MNKKKEEFEEVGFQDDVSFFGEDVVADPSEVIKKALEVVEDDEEEEEGVTDLSKKNKKTSAKEEEEEEDEEDDDFFSGPITDEDEEEDDNQSPIKIKKGEDAPTSSPKIAGLNFLKEKGFIEYELEEGEELTDELAEELLEEKWESSLDEAIEDLTTNLPKEGKDFLKFLSKGGDPKKFFATMADKGGDVFSKDTDIEEESNQIRIMTLELEKQDYDSEYIEAHIQTLKDTGKLSSVAKKIYDKRVAEKEAQSDSIAKSQAEAVKEAKERQKKYNNELKQYVSSLEDVKGFKLSPTDKKELADFASKATVQLKDGRVISGLQAGIYTAMADKEKLILLAKIVKEDFDLSFIEKKAVTKHTQNVRKGITNMKAKPNKVKRDLLDILGDDD